LSSYFFGQENVVTPSKNAALAALLHFKRIDTTVRI